MTDPRNNLAYWFPRLRDAGLPVPQTAIVHTDRELLLVLDGETPDGWGEFLEHLRLAARQVGEPFFLRTGYGSGKHDWDRTCYVSNADALERQVGALIEWSALAGFFGLPTDTWVVRELIPTSPICVCDGYAGMPVVREFRYFVAGGEVVHCQPYWPADAVEIGRPDSVSWREDLARISRLGIDERGWLGNLACEAATAVDPDTHWSVDLLEGADGSWWVTDMALGDESFRYEVPA